MSSTAHTRFRGNRNAVSLKVVIAVALVAALLPFGIQRAVATVNDISAKNAPEQVHANHAQPVAFGAITGKRIVAAGPITALDKELLVRVRLANLWELPAGRLAQSRGSNEQVKRAGMHLMDGHSHLDQIVREMAGALNVEIPNEPNADQQSWIKEMETLKGEEFDKYFANILRVAHGKIFPVVATVRSTTENTMIRDLATETIMAVSDHMEVLEDTGQVEPDTFDEVRKDVVKP
jgi:predicted outer membrane protein